MLSYADSPEALGISSAGLIAYLDAVARTPGQELHSLLLLSHGKIAAEMTWKPYGVDTPHVLFSLSKSFTSTAVGFAVSEGLFSLTDRVADLLPDKLPDAPSDRLLRITVSDILCMGSGLAPESDGGDPRQPDWAKRALSYPVVHEPGTTFHYNSISTFLASQIVQSKTGQTVRDYLMPRLFTPLGIKKPDWDSSPMGVNCGGWGLHLSTMDIAKFGQLLLDDGMWEGKRVLPEGWVETATTAKIDNSKRGGPVDWTQGYGYQFWRCRDGHYRGDGMFGQMCWVMPEQDAVVAITAGIKDMGKEAELLHDYLIPALSAPPSDEATQALLRERIAALSYPFPDGSGAPLTALAGRYVADTGDMLDLSFGEDNVLRVSISWKDEVRITLRFGLGAARKDTYAGRAVYGRHTYLGAYSWQGDTLRAVMRTPGAPFALIGSMTLEGDSLRAGFTGAGLAKEEQVYKRKSR